MMTAKRCEVTRIYTKRGDTGETSLFGGDPVSKADNRLEAYGNVDELNSLLGFAHSMISASPLADSAKSELDLRGIQNYLFTLGSHLACGEEKLRAKLPALVVTEITSLEARIDKMQAAMPELREFILPGGSPEAALLHMARTVCRRAERSVIRAFPDGVAGDHGIVTFLNRLSDFLFVAARFCNFKQGFTDRAWQKNP